MALLHKISGICQDWYEIAKNTHSLWTTICIAPGGTQTAPYGRFQLLKTLRRRLILCGPILPLKIHVALPDVLSYSHEDNSRPLYDALLSTVLAEHSHIEWLHIETHSDCHPFGLTRQYCMHGVIDTVKPWLRSHSPRMLKDLALVDQAQQRYVCNIQPDPSNEVSLPPHLEVLKIHATLVGTVSHSSCSGLKQLHLVGVTWPIPGDLMDVLELCSDQLETLTIEFFDYIPGPDPLRTVMLGSLHSLTLWYNPWFDAEMPLPLRTPILQHLSVRGHGNGRFQYQDLVSLFGYVPINHELSLDFESHNVNVDCLCRMIQSCPRLTSLSYQEMGFHNNPAPPLKALIEHIQQRDSPFTRLLVRGNNTRLMMDEWEMLRALSQNGFESMGDRRKVQLTFRPTIR